MNYRGTPMANFLTMIKDQTTTQLLHLIEGDNQLTIMQTRAIRAEIKSREI